MDQLLWSRGAGETLLKKKAWSAPVGIEWLVTIWRWTIYVFSNWGRDVASGGLWDIPGHCRHLIMASYVGGRGGNYLSSLYCQIIDSVRTIGAITSIHLGRVHPGSNATFVREYFSSFKMFQSRCHVPLCVLRTIVCRVSHEDTATKTASRERSRCWLTGTPFKRPARAEGWEGSTCHNLNSNLAMKSLKWIRVIFNSY